MTVYNCPTCGNPMLSVSIGWKCQNCGCCVDMHGNAHQHKEEPFLPPMTNADRIRTLSDEELAHYVYGRCQMDNPGDQHCPGDIGCYACTLDWLRQPAEKEAPDENH